MQLRVRDGWLLGAIDARILMNALFLIGLTYEVVTKRFVVTWDTGAIAVISFVAVTSSYLMTG